MVAASIWKWLLVALVVLLIFGTGKLRHIGKDLGSAINDFKKGLNGENDKNKPKIDETQDEPQKKDPNSPS